MNIREDQAPQYCKPLEVIITELMQKYEKEDNKIGVDDIERWPCDSYATEFLSPFASEVFDQDTARSEFSQSHMGLPHSDLNPASTIHKHAMEQRSSHRLRVICTALIIYILLLFGMK